MENLLHSQMVSCSPSLFGNDWNLQGLVSCRDVVQAVVGAKQGAHCGNLVPKSWGVAGVDHPLMDVTNSKPCGGLGLYNLTASDRALGIIGKGNRISKWA